MVEEGLLSKSNKINDDSQIRLQDTMEKIINDGNGGMVFIIIWLFKCIYNIINKSFSHDCVNDLFLR